MTVIQVTASTSSAVSQFDAFAASVARARQQIERLSGVMGAATTGVARRYGDGFKAIRSSFDSLLSTMNRLTSVAMTVTGAVQFAFSAMIRELDKLQGFQAIMSVTTSSADGVSRSYDFLRKTADELGVQFDALTSNYAKLVAALPAGVEGLRIAEKTFMGVAMAARTMHSTNADTQLMFYAITQMASKGVISMEELNRQLAEKLPGVMQIAASALRTTPALLEAAIRKGSVDSIKFLDYFSAELIRRFKGPSEIAANSVSASINRLTNVWIDFVKQVLDSGAGAAVAGMFDTIRDKLKDPYVVNLFAQNVKFLADKLTEMISNLSKDDIRNGFDTFTSVLSGGVKVLQAFVNLLQWVINNGGKAGAIIGGALGALTFAPAGLPAAAAGAVAGAGSGFILGRKAMPTGEDLSSRKLIDANARAIAASERANNAMLRAEQSMFRATQLLPKLAEFKGITGIAELSKALKPNTATIEELNKILSGKEFKTDKSKLEALQRYAETGSSKLPSLQDVLKPGKGLNPGKGLKRSADEKSLDATALKAAGFNTDFKKEYNNLRKLLDSGQISEKVYNEGVDRLLAKQPVIIEHMKQQEAIQKAINESTRDWILDIMRGEKFKESFNAQLTEEYKIAQLLGPEAQLVAQVEQARLAHLERGVVLTKEELVDLKEKYKIITETARVTQIATDMWEKTVNRNQGRNDTLAAIDKNLADKSGKFTTRDASDYLVQTMPTEMQGTAEYYDLMKRQVQDYFTFVDGLRQRDVISEQTAEQMKLRAASDYQSLYLSQASGFFGNLAVLSKSSNKKIAAIGKAAAIIQATIEGRVAILKALAAASPPWNYILAAGVAVQVGANIAAIRAQSTGFKSGGYTGNIGVNDIAGAVHGKEYVFDAPATARIGVNRLEDLRSGDAQIVHKSMFDESGYRSGGYVGSSNDTVRQVNSSSMRAIEQGVRTAQSTQQEPTQSETVTQPIRIVNVLDPAIVEDYLSTPAGETVLLNVLRKNRDQVLSI